MALDAFSKNTRPNWLTPRSLRRQTSHNHSEKLANAPRFPQATQPLDQPPLTSQGRRSSSRKAP